MLRRIKILATRRRSTRKDTTGTVTQHQASVESGNDKPFDLDIMTGKKPKKGGKRK